jgi:hypothetical protein
MNAFRQQETWRAEAPAAGNQGGSSRLPAIKVDGIHAAEDSLPTEMWSGHLIGPKSQQLSRTAAHELHIAISQTSLEESAVVSPLHRPPPRRAARTRPGGAGSSRTTALFMEILTHVHLASNSDLQRTEVRKKSPIQHRIWPRTSAQLQTSTRKRNGIRPNLNPILTTVVQRVGPSPSRRWPPPERRGEGPASRHN